MAVKVRCKCNALFLYLAERGKGKYLKSAAVGKYGTLPCCKFMQTAKVVYYLVIGAKMKVIGIAKHYLTAQLLKVACRYTALDSGGGGNVHKYRGLYCSVRGNELA